LPSAIAASRTRRLHFPQYFHYLFPKSYVQVYASVLAPSNILLATLIVLTSLRQCIYLSSLKKLSEIIVDPVATVADRPQGLNEGLLINIDVLQCMVSWLIDVGYILQKLWIIVALDKCNDFLDFNLLNR